MHGCADQFRAITLDSVLENEGSGTREIGGRQAISISRKTWREGDQGPAGLEEPIAHLSRAPQKAVDGRRGELGHPVGRSTALSSLQIRRSRTAQRWRALSNETASAHQEQDDTGIPPCFTAICILFWKWELARCARKAASLSGRASQRVHNTYYARP